jgi:hypothetical protein
MNGERLFRVLRIFLPASAILFGACLVALWTDLSFADLSRDPIATSGGHNLTGILSNLGLLGWCATVTICSFGAALLDFRRDGDRFWFFSFAAALTSLLLFDDMLMLHDRFLPAHGITQPMAIGTYVFLTGALLVRFRQLIPRETVPVLGLSLVFFSLSVSIDAIPPGEILYHHLFEDGFKFLGIAGWLGFFSITVFGVVRDPKRNPGATAV